MSLLHLIFVALVWRTAAATPVNTGASITYVSSTQTSITMEIDDEWQDDVEYSLERDTGKIEVLAAELLTAKKTVTDDKTPALEPATAYGYTLTMAKGSETPATKPAILCTTPEALKSVTEAKDADGTTLVLTVVTGEGKTTGVYIDDLSAGLTAADPTVASEDGTDVGTATDKSDGGAKTKWQLAFKTEAAASGTYKVTMPSFPNPAPTYTVKPYFGTTCEADALGEAYSVANKVSMEAMFVYGVVGLMALILRALGLESYGLF